MNIEFHECKVKSFILTMKGACMSRKYQEQTRNPLGARTVIRQIKG